jgi:hypothetical protein
VVDAAEGAQAQARVDAAAEGLGGGAEAVGEDGDDEVEEDEVAGDDGEREEGLAGRGVGARVVSIAGTWGVGLMEGFGGG